MGKKKALLIEQRSEAALVKGEDGKYVLEGTFTEFNKKNRNGRIYEAKEMMPHIQGLQKQIKESKLLGELDHPKNFEVSYKNASHVIESLEFDEEQGRIIGRVRLLNTSNGKEARALCDDGIPLHISSRAAGVVEGNGKVKIKKLFTYDLVADPGFASATLERVNEAYGIDPDSGINLYEVEVDENFFDDVDGVEQTVHESVNKDHITREDFNSYTELVKSSTEKAFEGVRGEINSIKEEVAKLVEAAKAKPEGDAEELTESRLEELLERISTLEKTSENLIKHNDYIVENLEKVTSYSELIAKTVNEGAGEGGDFKKLVAYAEMLAGKLDETIEYTKYVTEEVNKRFDYQTMVNEHVDALISHNDYIVETVDSVAKYGDYLKEHIEGLGTSVDQIHEGLKALNEGKAPTGPAKPVDEANSPENTGNASDDLDKAVDEALNGNAEEHVADNTKYPFYPLLSRERRAEFDSMEESDRERVVKAYESNRYFGSVDVSRIWEHATTEQPKGLNWLKDAPEKYKRIWEGLSPERRNAIKAQASVRQLATEYQIVEFWDTRELRDTVIPVTEGNQHKVTADEDDSTYRTDSAWMQSVVKGFKERFSAK